MSSGCWRSFPSSRNNKGAAMIRTVEFLKGRLALAAVVVALGAAVSVPSARADTVLFNPTGGGFGAGQTGNIFNVASFAYDNGNTIAIGGQTAINNFLAGAGPTTFQLVFQSTLGAVNASNSLGNVISINPNLPVPPGPAQGNISIQDNVGNQLTNTHTEIILRGTFTD